MEKLYKNKEDYTDFEIKNFVEENKDQLKIEYIDFKYAILFAKQHVISIIKITNDARDKYLLKI